MSAIDAAEVKAATDILKVIERTVQLKRDGDLYVGLCPFHDESSPSFKVYTAGDPHYHCFGCGEHGDVFDFVMKKEGRTFKDALDELARDARIIPDSVPYRPQTHASSTNGNGNGNGHTNGSGTKSKDHGPIIEQTSYMYSSADGATFVKVRLDYQDGDKDFVWYTEAGYKAKPPLVGLGGAQLADLELYGHKDVLSAPEDEVIIFAEGEKAWGALVDHGFLAVCHAGGAHTKKFGTSLEVLRGREVYLWPDNDEPGRKFMASVAAALHGIAAKIYNIDLYHADIQEKDDAFDYLALFSADNVRTAIKNARPIHTQDAGSTKEAHTNPSARQTLFIASDLLTMELREPKMAVPGLLPEGLSILGSKPKMGKSWMALGLSVAVATGGAVLGSIPVEGGDVLYLALEDNPRRLQSRLKKVLGVGAPVVLDHLTLVTEWPRLDKTGLTLIRGWLETHPLARLVVIDTWARIKPRVRTSGSAYDEDYASVEGLQQLASELGVAILIITHLRKMDADDPLDTLNATLGFSGGADSILILKRERGRHDANLFVSGRDVEEQDLALKWDADIAAWSVIGNAEEYRLSEARKEIMDVLRSAFGPMAPKDVAQQLGKERGTVTKLMWEMSKAGELTSADGKYAIRQ